MKNMMCYFIDIKLCLWLFVTLFAELDLVACNVTFSRSDARVRYGNICHDLITGITSQAIIESARARRVAESIELCSDGRRVELNRFGMEHSGFCAG